MEEKKSKYGTPPYKKLSDEVRNAVVEDLKSGQYGRNEIARRNDVGKATVTTIAKAEGLDSARGIIVTENATRAVAASVREKRERAKEDLLDDIQRLRHRAWSPYVKVVSGKDGPVDLYSELPPLPDVAQAYRSIGIALDGFFKLEALDAQGSSQQEARDFLTDLHGALSAARAEYEAMEGNRPPELSAGGGDNDDEPGG